MINFNEIKISIYRNYTDTTGDITSLADFLQPDQATVQAILNLRQCQDKKERDKIKATLPQAAISGVFLPTRSNDNLFEHSGFICIDLDANDNPHLSADTMKHRVSTLQYVAFAALSASGRGVFCLVPISNPDNHARHYDECCNEFERFLGLHPDRACKNLSRLRCVTYDPAPYINPTAHPYTGLARQEQHHFTSHTPTLSDDATILRVYAAVNNLEQFHIDITNDYADWFRIGASLASLGEEGREAFHRVSAISGKYNDRQCNRKFDELLRNARHINIGTFIHYYNLYCGLELNC